MCRFFALVAAVLLAAYAPAQAAQKPIFAVVLTRHGVRSLTSMPRAYAWANWSPVADGDLTQHGYALMTFMGAYYAKSFGDEGLSVQCTPANVFVYADTDQRTIETGRALIEGLCGSAWTVPLNHDATLNPSLGDTLFDDAPSLKAPVISSAQVQRAASALEAMQEVLDRRCDGTCTALAQQSQALNTAASDAEDLFLEYAQCRPLDDIDPGHSDTVNADLQAVMQLHELTSDLQRRSEPIAQERGGNLFAHIVALLQAKAATPFKGIDGPDISNDNIAFIVGHDTNIANVAGIIGAHWQLSDGYVADDTPPGGALVFELLRGDDGTYSVHLRFVHQTLPQLRSSTAIVGGTVSEPVSFAGCTGTDCTMPLADFAKIADRLVAEHDVRPQWTALSDGFVDLPDLADPSWTKCN